MRLIVVVERMYMLSMSVDVCIHFKWSKTNTHVHTGVNFTDKWFFFHFYPIVVWYFVICHIDLCALSDELQLFSQVVDQYIFLFAAKCVTWSIWTRHRWSGSSSNNIQKKLYIIQVDRPWIFLPLALFRSSSIVIKILCTKSVFKNIHITNQNGIIYMYSKAWKQKSFFYSCIFTK